MGALRVSCAQRKAGWSQRLAACGRYGKEGCPRQAPLCFVHPTPPKALQSLQPGATNVKSGFNAPCSFPALEVCLQDCVMAEAPSDHAVM
eukprot:602765-Amphidinium_carterae.1